MTEANDIQDTRRRSRSGQEMIEYLRWEEELGEKYRPESRPSGR